jgi:hypothetical protein
MSRKDQAEALLRGRIKLAREEADQYIDALAAKLKVDYPNQPLGSIRLMLTQGDTCKCAVALRLMEKN